MPQSADRVGDPGRSFGGLEGAAGKCRLVHQLATVTAAAARVSVCTNQSYETVRSM